MNLNAISTVKKNKSSELNLNSEDLFSFKRETTQERTDQNSINSSIFHIHNEKF